MIGNVVHWNDLFVSTFHYTWLSRLMFGFLRSAAHRLARKGWLPALKASPRDHIAPPSSTTSFNRNCPGSAESAGKPSRLGSHPGVENKNESVVRNISTAMALPMAHAFGDQARRAINIAMPISTTPSPAENCRTDH